jgi:hypothetical protein
LRHSHATPNKEREVFVSLSHSDLPTKWNEYVLSFVKIYKKTCTETLNMIKVAFVEDSMSHTQVFEWFCSFKEGRMSVKRDAKCKA